MRTFIVLLVQLSLLGFATDDATSQIMNYEFRTVAMADDEYENGTDFVFERFSGLSLNRHGAVSFVSDLDSDRYWSDAPSAVFAENGPSGGLRLVAGSGIVSTQVPKFEYSRLHRPYSTDSGDVILGTSRNLTKGFFLGQTNADSVANLVLDGTLAPGGSPSATFNSQSFPTSVRRSISTNGSGEIAFRGDLDDSRFRDRGIWKASTSGIVPLAVRGGASAVIDDTYTTLFHREMDINSSGQVVFGVKLEDSGTGVFLGDENGLELVYLMTSDTSISFSHILVNDAKDVAFNTTTVFPGTLRARINGNLATVATVGENAVGTDGRFSGIDNLQLNNLGQLAFVGSLSGDNVNDSNDVGIWFYENGNLELLARDGEVIDGVTATMGSDIIANPERMPIALNNNGDLMFQAGDGIFARRSGILKNVLKIGDLFDVSDDPLAADLRTIASLSFLGDYDSWLDHALPMQLNDDGQFVFELTFTDSTNGVFVGSINAVPEPRVFYVTLLFAMILCLRRSRPRASEFGIRLIPE